MISRERQALAWGKIRRYYNAILIGDPFPQDPIAAEIEFIYWDNVRERRAKLAAYAGHMPFYEGWLDGRNQGLQEIRIRAGGDPFFANWKRDKLLQFATDLLKQHLILWQNQSLNRQHQRAEVIRYRHQNGRWPENWQSIIGSNWGEGLSDGYLVGLNQGIDILLGRWYYHSGFPRKGIPTHG